MSGRRFVSPIHPPRAPRPTGLSTFQEPSPSSASSVLSSTGSSPLAQLGAPVRLFAAVAQPGPRGADGRRRRPDRQPGVPRPARGDGIDGRRLGDRSRPQRQLGPRVGQRRRHALAVDPAQARVRVDDRPGELEQLLPGQQAGRCHGVERAGTGSPRPSRAPSARDRARRSAGSSRRAAPARARRRRAPSGAANRAAGRCSRAARRSRPRARAARAPASRPRPPAPPPPSAARTPVLPPSKTALSSSTGSAGQSR